MIIFTSWLTLAWNANIEQCNLGLTRPPLLGSASWVEDAGLKRVAVSARQRDPGALLLKPGASRGRMPHVVQVAAGYDLLCGIPVKYGLLCWPFWGTLMCLAVPGYVLSVDEADPLMRLGRVRFGGVIREVALALVPEATLGDYVVVHAGVAISRLDEAQANATLAELDAMGALEAGLQELSLGLTDEEAS